MKLLNTNRFYLKGTDNRFIHLATVHHGFGEYICFVDKRNQQVYIEELSGGHLAFIDDDALAQGLTDFLTLRGVLDMTKPMIDIGV